MSKKNVQMIRRIALAAPLALAVVAIMAAEQGLPNRQSVAPAASPALAETEASPAPASQVTVNGEPVPVGEDGTATVQNPSGDTKVTVSGNTTTVATETSKKSSSQSTGNNDSVQVNVSSDNSGGSNWGSTQVFGFSTSNNGNSTSFSTTNVFSTGTNHTNVASP